MRIFCMLRKFSEYFFKMMVRQQHKNIIVNDIIIINGNIIVIIRIGKFSKGEFLWKDGIL